MRADYRVIELDEFNHNLLINGLNEFRNMLLQQEKHPLCRFQYSK